MFGMGFFEILLIAVVAIIFLGPEKLPRALVDVAKFLKAVKKTMDEAKESLDKEVNLSKIKEEALAYKNSLTQGVENLTKEMDLKDISSLDFYEEKEPPKETATQDSATFNKEAIEVKPASIKETLDFKNNNNP
ncbi:Sec-independent protein translocase subunit TatB [Helicobacter apodemus]|mgnify:FL=1|uniref:Sec-independent protein translocase protein TatB homolog n=1 Tax=Helicobacter apodemus TaxID=135569 RepID=A0A4U8UBS5_9HELI|nr:Sec-independent protein translocase protein TatB [Helicobacter apodemus]TLE14172.1 Sec-independent protein translocase subunit TatB [Helicobacter apodemus]